MQFGIDFISDDATQSSGTHTHIVINRIEYIL